MFFSNDKNSKEIRYVPYEVKETTLKSGLAIVGMLALDYIFAPPKMFYSLGVMFFGFHWIYRVTHLMGHAVTKIDLHSDGEHVTFTYKTGFSKTLKIRNIHKKKHEKTLVETFEEAYLFPVEINEAGVKKTAYLYGNGQ